MWDLLRDTDGYYLNHHVLLVDFTEVERLRERSSARGEPKPSYVACVLHAMSRVLPRHPVFNSYLRTFPTPKLALYDAVDIAFTVEKRDGDRGEAVLLHVLRDSGSLPLAAIAAHLRELSARPLSEMPYLPTYRAFLAIPSFLRMALFRLLCKPFPERMRQIGGTCAFTSVGREGTDFTMPLSPKSLTVSLGRVATRPFAAEGGLDARRCAHLTLTYDHRVADGNACARLGQDLKRFLESAREED